MKDKPIELYRFQMEVFIDVKLVLRTYKILDYTPKGYWIDLYSQDRLTSVSSHEPKRKWVGVSDKWSKKRFAYATKKEAMEHFQRRSLRRIEFLKGSIFRVVEALKISSESEFAFYDKRNIDNRDLIHLDYRVFGAK